MSGTVLEAVAALRAAHDALAGCDFDSPTRAELVSVMDEMETLGCQLPNLWHRTLASLTSRCTPKEMGAKSWKDVLAIRWRLSRTEANRRLNEAALLGPRQTLTGEQLEPVLPATAVAQAAGAINPEHVKVIRDAVADLPDFVDPVTRAQFELDRVRTAMGAGPKATKDAAERALFLLDQDGPEPDDAERARKRGMSACKQGRDGMTAVAAHLTPEAWATWEAIFAKYAAPGMCNPDDPEPCTSGTPTQEQIDSDHRSLAQRQHDALLVVGRIALMSGNLGQLNGLPVTLIIRTTVQDLESRAGVGVSGGGTVMPIADVIRLAGHARQYLAVFDGATGAALNLFRSKRVASPAQRIMLIARDGGCTKPGCTVGAYGCQAHHAFRDWIHGGNTNVDELGLACGGDNRMVGSGEYGWTTTINNRGEVEWIPPSQLDTGQTRINYHHRPEKLLRPPDDAEDAMPEGSGEPSSPPGQRQPAPPESQSESASPEEPGGPAPPDDQVA
jgi:hypothetical protein